MNWNYIFYHEFRKIYFLDIKKYILKEIKKGKIILPNKNKIFNAFNFTKFDLIKVVIIGQDPYYKHNQANGIAFSVDVGVNIPYTLNNIFKEIKRSIYNFNYPTHGYLYNWCIQGVLLLNSSLTVEIDKPNSHKYIGWDILIKNIINFINLYKKKIIFVFWGKESQKLIKYIDNKKHYILISSHPSPLSFNKGFYGCNHFYIINEILYKNNLNIIDWNI